MNKNSENFIESLANELGADYILPLDLTKSQGPLELIHLQAELHRLKSSGGRPTDPQWTVKRLVPFTEQNWQKLGQVTEKMKQEGHSISPSQLAALLIEEGLSRLFT
jgi:hypothetical protein